MARVESNGFKEVQEIYKGGCFGCEFRQHDLCNCPNIEYCENHACILVKENTSRKDAWDTISDYFEEWSNSSERNGADMIAVAQDAIVADNIYLAFQIEDLANLDKEEFKKECLQLIKKFQ